MKKHLTGFRVKPGMTKSIIFAAMIIIPVGVVSAVKIHQTVFNNNPAAVKADDPSTQATDAPKIVSITNPNVLSDIPDKARGEMAGGETITIKVSGVTSIAGSFGDMGTLIDKTTDDATEFQEATTPTDARYLWEIDTNGGAGADAKGNVGAKGGRTDVFMPLDRGQTVYGAFVPSFNQTTRAGISADFRIGTNDIYHRVVVAGGAGGGGTNRLNNGNYLGGVGGGIPGGSGVGKTPGVGGSLVQQCSSRFAGSVGSGYPSPGGAGGGFYNGCGPSGNYNATGGGGSGYFNSADNLAAFSATTGDVDGDGQTDYEQYALKDSKYFVSNPTDNPGDVASAPTSVAGGSTASNYNASVRVAPVRYMLYDADGTPVKNPQYNDYYYSEGFDYSRFTVKIGDQECTNEKFYYQDPDNQYITCTAPPAPAGTAAGTTTGGAFGQGGVFDVTVTGLDPSTTGMTKSKAFTVYDYDMHQSMPATMLPSYPLSNNFIYFELTQFFTDVSLPDGGAVYAYVDNGGNHLLHNFPYSGNYWQTDKPCTLTTAEHCTIFTNSNFWGWQKQPVVGSISVYWAADQSSTFSHGSTWTGVGGYPHPSMTGEIKKATVTAAWGNPDYNANHNITLTVTSDSQDFADGIPKTGVISWKNAEGTVIAGPDLSGGVTTCSGTGTGSCKTVFTLSIPTYTAVGKSDSFTAQFIISGDIDYNDVTATKDGLDPNRTCGFELKYGDYGTDYDCSMRGQTYVLTFKKANHYDFSDLRDSTVTNNHAVAVTANPGGVYLTTVSDIDLEPREGAGTSMNTGTIFNITNSHTWTSTAATGSSQAGINFSGNAQLYFNNGTSGVVSVKGADGALGDGDSGAGIGYPAGASATGGQLVINGGVVYATSGYSTTNCGEGIGRGGGGSGTMTSIRIFGGANVNANGCVGGSGSTVANRTSIGGNPRDNSGNLVYPVYFDASKATSGTFTIDGTDSTLYNFSAYGDTAASGVFWLTESELATGVLGSTDYYAYADAQVLSFADASSKKENIFLNEAPLSLSTSASAWNLPATPNVDSTAASANPSASVTAKVSAFTARLSWNLTMQFVNADGTASSDGALICSTNSALKFAAGSGTLANTWGYGIGTTKPTTAWLKAPFSAATTIASGTGPMTSGGTTSDTTVWVGANVTTAIAPCASYKGAMIFTVLPAS